MDSLIEFQVDKSSLDFEEALISTLLNSSQELDGIRTHVFVARSFGDLATENIFRSRNILGASLMISSS